MKILLIIGLCFTMYSIIMRLFTFFIINCLLNTPNYLVKFEDTIEKCSYLCFILGLCLTSTWGIIKIVSIWG